MFKIKNNSNRKDIRETRRSESAEEYVATGLNDDHRSVMHHDWAENVAQYDDWTIESSVYKMNHQRQWRDEWSEQNKEASYTSNYVYPVKRLSQFPKNVRSR